MRKNPMLWEDAPPEGVLAPFEGGDDADGALKLLGLQTSKSMVRARDVRADDAAGPAVHDALSRISVALDAARGEDKAWRMTLDAMDPHDRAHLFDALGEGEVSIVIAGASGEGEAQISETVLPGVWVGRAADEAGALAAHWIEVGAAPRALRETAISRPRPDIPVEALTAPRGAMNVMAVLAEIRERAKTWRPGELNHVMNFTLFPMTPEDTAFLAKTLGEVGVRIASGGYGAARVIMTAVRHVWAVQYLNGLGAVILDTVEIGDIPDAVLASREDFEDSASRLREITETYAP